jgi:hypothetical protein
MKEITIQISDKKFDFFIELMNQLGIRVYQEEEAYIPELHKSLVRERIKKSIEDPKRLLDWNQVRDNFTFS